MIELNFKSSEDQLWFLLNLDVYGPRFGIKFALLRGDPVENLCYDGDKNTVVNNPEDYLRIRERFPDLVRKQD